MRTAFRTLLLEGLRRFSAAGYVSEADLQEWTQRLHAMIESELPTDEESREVLAGILGGIYGREFRSGIAKRVPGVSRYTLERVSPYLRAELDRRIFAAADLIKLNRGAAIEKTLQRFAGWTSAQPQGQFLSGGGKLRDAAEDILKPIAQLKYERRRCAIDQGMKLVQNVAAIVAQEEGAIAAIWHDRGTDDHGYDARPKHLARSGKLFLIRNSWAIQEGLVRRGATEYTDEVEAPSYLVYCSCWYEYITKVQRLPETLLTSKGRAYIKPIRNDAVPTPAQIEAGNYPKGHIRRHGLDITIETRAGETRSGIGADGRPWSVVMPADYGYIRRTIGADGEQVDCYVGPDEKALEVYVVDQLDATTRAFDEHKAFIGFAARSIALETYESGFSDGRGRLRIGNIREFTPEIFRQEFCMDPDAFK